MYRYVLFLTPNSKLFYFISLQNNYIQNSSTLYVVLGHLFLSKVRISKLIFVCLLAAVISNIKVLRKTCYPMLNSLVHDHK